MSGNKWSHPNKEWQQTLNLARKFGWDSEPALDHGGMTLYCPSRVHKFRVFTTGKAAESVARSKRNTIRSCEHRNITDAVDEVELKLTDADRMLGAAEALTQRSEADSQMQHAVEMLAEADQNLSEVDHIFDTATASLAEADAAIERALASDVTAGADELVRSAGTQVRDAKLALRDLPDGHERVQSLSAWRNELGERVGALRARLTTH